jgi:hypothetical protein
MIKEKVVFETEDDKQFATKYEAEHHIKLGKFEKDFDTLLLQAEDILHADAVFDFIMNNHKELHFMLLELNEVN